MADSVDVAVSGANNDVSVSSSNYSIHLEGFDLDESLAAAEEACRRFAAAKSFVSSLPMLVTDSDDDVCSICMEGFHRHKSAEGNRKLSCGHVYHGTCITTWLSRSTSCPFCRSGISLK